MKRTDLLDLESRRVHRVIATPLELRAATDGPDTIRVWDGHASVTEHEYPIWGGTWPGWMETIKNGAFKKTLAEGADVAFLVNHDGMTLARTKSGTLELDEDDVGLHSVAQLDTRIGAVNDLVVAAERGDVDEMSFAFRVVQDEWFDDDGNESNAWDGTVRHITEINLNKGDVSAVNYGANDAASGEVNALDHALAELRAGRTLDAELRAALRDLVDGIRRDDAPPAEPVGMPLALAQARADASRRRHRNTAA